MSEQTVRDREFRFTGFHMILCMIAFFGTIIAVNLFMATLASRSWTGLVVRNSYVASQNFNAELALAREQKARGWHSVLSYSNAVLRFRLVDAKGEPLSAETMQLSLGRPAYEQEDRKLELKFVDPGLYEARLELEPGLWDLRLDGRVGSQEYRRDARLFVRSGYSGTLQ